MTPAEYIAAKEFLAKRGLVPYAGKPEVVQAMVEYGDWRVAQAMPKEKSCSNG